MKIVIDSNRVIAALIKESTTRELLFNENFEFYAPDLTITEITKKLWAYIKKNGLQDKKQRTMINADDRKKVRVKTRNIDGYQTSHSAVVIYFCA